MNYSLGRDYGPTMAQCGGAGRQTDVCVLRSNKGEVARISALGQIYGLCNATGVTLSLSRPLFTCTRSIS